MLAASGCHKDSFNFDEFTRPTTTTPDDGTGLPTRTPNIGIFSPTAATQEGDAVVLMITSDANAPAGGLVVMISIGVATDGEFTANAPCTANLVCTVTILEGNRVGNLVLMPTSDAAVENSERWTASLVDGGSNYNFAANNNVAFDITDPPTTPDPMPLVVGIATGDMPIEGGAAVTLTITSSETVPATLIGGLSVTINIVGADAADFNNAVCTNIVCIVTIPAGGSSVSLILSPLSDFSAEPGERWTATLVDDDNNDYDLAANDNAGFDIDDLIAAVGIMTSNTGIEGGAAVTLTITSSETVPATLTDGLTVTINIGDADAGEFTSANCIALVCEVVIDPTETTAILIITPSPDTAVEGGSEDWTATIAPDTDNNIFMVDSSANDAVFAVVNMLPPVVDGTMLMALNAYATPTALSVNLIRNLQSDAIGLTGSEVSITASRYDDANGNPQIYVQMLEFAALGVWVNGNTPEIGTTDHDFDYAFLGDNGVNPPADTDGRGTATYNVEGDATYRGLNFFPDGQLMMDFDALTFGGTINALEGVATQSLNFFGGVDPTPGGTDFFSMSFTNGDITPTGFEVSGFSITGLGVFMPLNGITDTELTGRFYNDVAGYAPDMAPPTELAGVVETTIGGGADELKMGFLGRCTTNC